MNFYKNIHVTIDCLGQDFVAFRGEMRLEEKLILFSLFDACRSFADHAQYWRHKLSHI